MTTVASTKGQLVKLIRSLIAFGNTLGELPRERSLNVKVGPQFVSVCHLLGPAVTSNTLLSALCVSSAAMAFNSLFGHTYASYTGCTI